jgi:hypothetical protein
MVVGQVRRDLKLHSRLQSANTGYIAADPSVEDDAGSVGPIFLELTGALRIASLPGSPRVWLPRCVTDRIQSGMRRLKFTWLYKGWATVKVNRYALISRMPDRFAKAVVSSMQVEQSHPILGCLYFQSPFPKLASTGDPLSTFQLMRLLYFLTSTT